MLTEADRAKLVAVRRACEFRCDPLDRAGGALTTAQARSLLGWRSARGRAPGCIGGRLLAVSEGGRLLLAAFRSEGATVAPALRAVIAAAPGATPRAMLQFLVEGDEGLGDERPIDVLRVGGDGAVARLVRFARSLDG